MHEVFNKFIVEDNELYIGRVTFHKEMAHTKEDVKGGGIWVMNRDAKILVLSGESHDFGPATFDMIKDCVDKGNVGTGWHRPQHFSGWTVFHMNDYGEEILVGIVK